MFLHERLILGFDLPKLYLGIIEGMMRLLQRLLITLEHQLRVILLLDQLLKLLRFGLLFLNKVLILRHYLVAIHLLEKFLQHRAMLKQLLVNDLDMVKHGN